MRYHHPFLSPTDNWSMAKLSEHNPEVAHRRLLIAVLECELCKAKTAMRVALKRRRKK